MAVTSCLGKFLTSFENMVKDSATALFPHCDETLALGCCGFSEHPPGHWPWSGRRTKHAETVGQPAPYPEAAQEQGEGLSSCKQKSNSCSFF